MGGSFSVENDLGTTIEVKHYTTGGGIALQGKAAKRGEPVIIEKGCEALITEEVAQGSFYYFEVHVVGTPVKAGSNFYSMGDKKLKASEILKKGGARPPKKIGMSDDDESVTSPTRKAFDPADGITPYEGTLAEAIAKVDFIPDVTQDSFSDEADLDTPTGSTITLPCTLPEIWHLLLADSSNFCQEYHTSRNDENIQITPWTRSGTYGGMRVANMIGATPFGPKSYSEAQRFVYCKEGATESLVYHRSGQVPDIMYGASFRTESFHKFTRTDGDEGCTMYSKSRINWVDTCPKLLKMTITKSALKELKKAGKPIEDLVTKYVTRHVSPQSSSPPAKKSKGGKVIRSPDAKGKPAPAEEAQLPPQQGIPVKHAAIMLALVALFSMVGAFVGTTLAMSGYYVAPNPVVAAVSAEI
eukprot:TRINITY_DN18541_c0_g1_i1.p1 TRINITY_DN18541_c0_g1~~TRINITY_DN18541_c0_g1_i1.p1  ORF type:complete len:431 (+),score=140.86 TRINITY_DN18541_c0_g1_i1:53-1294(+)